MLHMAIPIYWLWLSIMFSDEIIKIMFENMVFLAKVKDDTIHWMPWSCSLLWDCGNTFICSTFDSRLLSPDTYKIHNEPSKKTMHLFAYLLVQIRGQGKRHKYSGTCETTCRISVICCDCILYYEEVLLHTWKEVWTVEMHVCARSLSITCYCPTLPKSKMSLPRGHCTVSHMFWFKPLDKVNSLNTFSRPPNGSNINII